VATVSEPQETSGFLKSIRDAVLGDPHRDFTSGPIGRAITMLAIPMVLEMMMESLFAVVDVFWVAHLGPDAIATVGFTESLLTLLYSVALGLSIATTATVARRIGEKNPEAAGEVAAQAFLLGIGIAAILGIAGYAFAPTLLEKMGALPPVVATGSGYARAIYAGSGAVLLLFLLNGVFRGSGDAAIAMRVLWTANIINMVLNPCLIFGLGPFPKLGVTGSGIGTTIGRTCGVVLQLWFLAGGHSRVKMIAHKIRPVPSLMWHLIRLSVGGAFQYLVGASSWILLVRMNAAFGSAAIAAYTVAMRVIMFALLPSWGMASAAATLVGQNLGAGKPDRAEKSVYIAGFYNMVFLGVVAITFVVFARQIVLVFTDDPNVVPLASSTLRIVAYGYIFYAWGMVISQSFNGAGDTTTPTILNLVCFWAWQIPLAWFLAFKMNLGPNGIFWAIAIAQSTLAILSVIAFRRGTWKQQRV
jgi:putative MATE family efflux protein